MSDEEKEAIEIVKGITEDDLLNYWEGAEEPYNAIQTILNLIENLIFKTETQKELLKYKTDKIEKQSKEIEGLKEDNKKKSIVIIEYQYLYEKLEDKIKAKIEEYDKFQKEMTFKNHNADNINDCYRYGDKAQKALYQKEALQSLFRKGVNI